MTRPWKRYKLANFYQELVLWKHEVDLELKFKGPSSLNNNSAIQLQAKINYKHYSKTAGMMAIPCPNEVNIAHVANYGDLCRHALCRGKRKTAKHLWSECRRNPNSNNNKLRSNNTGTKFDRGAKNGLRTNLGGNNYPGSNNNGSNNITNYGYNPSRFGGKQNFGNNSNYRGPERRDGKSLNDSRSDNKYSNKFNKCTSRDNNFNQGIKEHSQQNIGGFERTRRGKYNNQVVKGAMYAIQKQLPDGRKRYAKDFQAALLVKDFSDNFAKNGDIYQLQHGLDKVHEEDFRKTHALSYQKRQKGQIQHACGLMAENRRTHTRK